MDWSLRVMRGRLGGRSSSCGCSLLALLLALPLSLSIASTLVGPRRLLRGSGGRWRTLRSRIVLGGVVNVHVLGKVLGSWFRGGGDEGSRNVHGWRGNVQDRDQGSWGGDEWRWLRGWDGDQQGRTRWLATSGRGAQRRTLLGERRGPATCGS